MHDVSEIAQGGTAVGTGLNTYEVFIYYINVIQN